VQSGALLALCAAKGIAAPPPIRRLIVEELRFVDAHGRAGVRNKRTRLLE
jgi:hypothetical protein